MCCKLLGRTWASRYRKLRYCTDEKHVCIKKTYFSTSSDLYMHVSNKLWYGNIQLWHVFVFWHFLLLPVGGGLSLKMEKSLQLEWYVIVLALVGHYTLYSMRSCFFVGLHISLPDVYKTVYRKCSVVQCQPSVCAFTWGCLSSEGETCMKHEQNIE